MFLKTGGYSIISEPGKADIEMDSFTCKHCNRVTFIHARTSPEDLGGRCTVCDGLICSQCVDKDCDVLEEKLRRMEDPFYKSRRVYRMASK